MDSSTFFQMEVKDCFGITGRGLVFKGNIRRGSVALGDKLAYNQDDGARISAAVKKIITKDETKKIFGLFGSGTKEIQSASEGQEVSIMVGDFFNVSTQSRCFPDRDHGGRLVKMSKITLLESFSD